MTDKKDETKKDEVKAPQAAVAIQVNDRGLVLKTLDDMWRYANYVVRAGIAPKGFETPEGVVVALQAGAEHRLTPMQSLQCIAVINKRPCFYGDAVPGMVESSGLQEYGFSKKVGERNPDGSYPDAYGYRYTTKRKGRDEYSYDFLVTDAKKAKLWGKEGPWTFYPDRMLLNRARTFCIRDVYPDVMAGLLTVDEANNIVNADSEGVDEDKSRTLENVIPVWQDIMIKQPTNQSVEVVPHQDADPKVNTIPDDILTFGLYLHDSSESLVCFLPKSHRLGVLTRDELNHYIETRMERFVSLTAEAGDISIHHATTIHYSKKNQTKHPRYTFYLTFRDIENLTQEKIWEKQWILSRQALFVYALKEYAPHYLKKYFSDNKYEQLQPYLDTLNFRLVHDTPKIKYKFESVFIK